LQEKGDNLAFVEFFVEAVSLHDCNVFDAVRFTQLYWLSRFILQVSKNAI